MKLTALFAISLLATQFASASTVTYISDCTDDFSGMMTFEVKMDSATKKMSMTEVDYSDDYCEHKQSNRVSSGTYAISNGILDLKNETITGRLLSKGFANELSKSKVCGKTDWKTGVDYDFFKLGSCAGAAAHEHFGVGGLSDDQLVIKLCNNPSEEDCKSGFEYSVVLKRK